MNKYLSQTQRSYQCHNPTYSSTHSASTADVTVCWRTVVHLPTVPSLHFVWLCRTSSDGKRTKSLSTDTLPAVSIPRPVLRYNLPILISLTRLQLRFHWQIFIMNIKLLIRCIFLPAPYKLIDAIINCNKLQTKKKYNSWQVSNSCMFRNRCSILRDSTITGE